MKKPLLSNRRSFLKTTGKSAIALSMVGSVGGSLLLSSCSNNPTAADTQSETILQNPFTTPLAQSSLPYAFDALVPCIDAETMEIHHGKHAAAYAKNFAEAREEEDLQDIDHTENALASISKYSTKMRNNAGGHYNHELFWTLLSPKAKQAPEGELLSAIDSAFGNFDTFKTLFQEQAMARFGSGWAWLVMQSDGAIAICSTPNQDNPLMDDADCKGIPLLAVDVWEHAYYLNYQNKRAEYLANLWNIIDWNVVENRFQQLKG